MKKRELKPKKTSTTFVPWKITEVYHTEVEYFNEAELKRMAENLCKLMDNYLKNKEREERSDPFLYPDSNCLKFRHFIFNY